MGGGRNNFLRWQSGFPVSTLGLENGLSRDPRLSRLIEMVEELNLALVRRYIAAGAEWMSYPEDLGMQRGPMLSPAHFRRYIKPTYARLMAPAREAGCVVHMHSDGDIRTLVDDLVDDGVQVVNLQDLVNGLDWIEERLAGRVCIDLDVDRQRVTRYGTPADIDALIEADLEKAVCDAADFSRADLRRSRFPLAIFRQTTIDSARVFGIEIGSINGESFIAQRVDLSREADGSRWVPLARFLKNPSGADDPEEQRLRRYVGPGDILRNAELSFESGAEVQVDGLLEHCELNMAEDASLIIGETGVLENCRVVGGRVRVNGCFLERSRVGLDCPVELIVSTHGAVATTLQQPASETQFGFAAGHPFKVETGVPNFCTAR